jgi:hypothetical protein
VWELKPSELKFRADHKVIGEKMKAFLAENSAANKRELRKRKVSLAEASA